MTTTLSMPVAIVFVDARHAIASFEDHWAVSTRNAHKHWAGFNAWSIETVLYYMKRLAKPTKPHCFKCGGNTDNRTHNFTPVIRSFSHSAVTRQGNWNNIFMFLFVLLLLFAFAAKSALVKQMKNIMKSFISRWVMLLIVWFAVKKRPNMTAFEMLCVECTPVDTINRRHNQGFSHWMALCVHVFSPHHSTWQPMTNFVKTYLRIRVKYIYLILLLCFRYILQMDICTLCHSYIRCASDDAHKSIPYYSLTHHCSVLCAAANLITIASNSLPASFMPNHNALYI